ncbi:MAG: Zinc carboxypeptidase, partial [Phycisphaerales bacterium]|nr:Zinc carboxypeptidase [Phycisphaerales bacterium]
MLFLRHGRRFLWLVLSLCGGVGCSTRPPVDRPGVLAPSVPAPMAPAPIARFEPAGPRTPTPMATAKPAPTPDKVLTLGRSVDGRPVTLHLFGDTAVGPANTVLIFGGIHGNEPTGAGVCRELVEYLRAHPSAWAGRCVAVLPEANPDGLSRKMRVNTRLVDLNRNFPAANWAKTRRSSMFGGDAPATQPETLLLVAAVDDLKPARVVAVHSMDAPCNNYDGPGEGLARLMAARNGYPVKASIGYPTPGSFGSWAGGDRKIPVITLELPNRGTTATSWAANRDALLAFVRADAGEIARASAQR